MALKSKKARAARKGVKSGGESPCKKCATVQVGVARTRLGRFAAKKKKR